MCGIFGFQTTLQNITKAKTLTKILLKISQERGREASGFSLKTHSINRIFKKPVNGEKLYKLDHFHNIFKNLKSSDDKKDTLLSVIGQCRLTTNGRAYIDSFNQPVFDNQISLVHNGIILNINDLIKLYLKNNFKNDEIASESDSFLLCKLINHFFSKNNNHLQNFNKISSKIKGSYSIAFQDVSNENIYLTSNNGSLYYYHDEDFIIFASEENFLKRKVLNKVINVNYNLIKKVEPGQFIIISNQKIYKNKEYQFNNDTKFKLNNSKISIHEAKIVRCKLCILPNTYPFITFNSKGVCNYCYNYKPFKNKNFEEFEKILDKARSKYGDPDCLVGLSGGRDSSYGLHILKTKFGMNPIAYSYDWGLTTEVSRRNQSLLTGKLGIEHVIRSPNLAKKRENIRKNIYAWLNRPKMGMVPLFMAGDKDFYQYGRSLRKKFNVDLTVFSSGQHYEQRNFFVGFCGVKDDLANVTARTYGYPINAKVKLASYYILQYILNPQYINESFYDSIRSFFTTFLFKDDFLYLFEYLKWDEKEIESTLKKEYGWEQYKIYGKNQWRMGDGQTAFTNYIFHRVAGFTEFDDFRSKQIRDGLITRDTALNLVNIDNKPKFEVLEDFAKTIGINLDHVISRINTIETLY